MIANNAQYKTLKASAGVMGLARSLGVEAHRVTEPDALTAAIAGSFDRGEPLLLEVPIER